MISDTPVSGEIRLENRYIKGEEISRYASTIVYKAIDRKKGIEVAWNQIQIVDTNVQKLMHEIDIFSSLRDPHTITFLDKCNISDPLCLVFTTELMTCSLRDFTLKANGVSLAVIKDWCTQVLEGLRYLHNIDPPIIHRDIQANNLFFDGSKGLVKIGVLGFETIADMNETHNIPGAPRFMAPEFDNEEKLYNVKVDIWAFGMCFIELTTLEYPYTECEAVYSVRQNVIKGIKPRAMFKISDPLLFDFIWRCLECDPNKRFSAEQLLNHPFIVEKDENDLITFVKIRDPEEVDQLVEQYGTTKEGWLAYAMRNAAFCKSDSEDQNINLSNTEPLIDSDNGKVPSTSYSLYTISRHQKHKSEINHSSEDELVFPDELVTSDDELLISSPDVNDDTKNHTNGRNIEYDRGSESSIKQNPLKGFSKYKNLQSMVDLSGSEDVLIEDISLSFSENDSPSAGSPRMFTNLKNLNAEAKIPESLALKHQAVLSPSREKKVTAKVDKLVKRNLILFEQNAESPQSPKKLPKQ